VKPTKVCANNAGALFTFIPVDVIKRLRLKSGEKLEWKVVKNTAKLKKIPEVVKPQE